VIDISDSRTAPGTSGRVEMPVVPARRVFGGRALGGLAAIALLMALPAAAQAAPGWKLPKFSTSVSGLSSSTTAKRCGSSKFGVWRFHQVLTAEGTRADARFRVKITKDGAAHRPTRVAVEGSAPASAKRSIRAGLDAVRFRHVAGSPPKLQSIDADSAPLSSRTFAPKRARC
jgi:hypothetical protein